MNAPPKQQKPRSFRFAFTLNFVLPGAGQIYLGQRVFGGAMALLFLTCFLATAVILFRGYAEYMSAVTGGDILQSDILEHLADVFHVRWLIGLLAGALVIFAISMIGLLAASNKVAAQKSPRLT